MTRNAVLIVAVVCALFCLPGCRPKLERATGALDAAAGAAQSTVDSLDAGHPDDARESAVVVVRYLGDATELPPADREARRKFVAEKNAVVEQAKADKSTPRDILGAERTAEREREAERGSWFDRYLASSENLFSIGVKTGVAFLLALGVAVGLWFAGSFWAPLRVVSIIWGALAVAWMCATAWIFIPIAAASGAAGISVYWFVYRPLAKRAAEESALQQRAIKQVVASATPLRELLKEMGYSSKDLNDLMRAEQDFDVQEIARKAKAGQ